MITCWVTKLKINKLFLGFILTIAVSPVAFGGGSLRAEEGTSIYVTDAGVSIAPSQATPVETSTRNAPLKPPSRLLPLKLIAPATAETNRPITGISISLQNPGDRAPNAQLRVSIHENDHVHARGYPQLSPDNVKLEVFENGSWIPVILSMVAGNVMGVIGAEGVAAHRERYKVGGFEIPPGLDKTWQLRVTFSFPGTYALVAAVSPDNGSRHLAQPAYSIITVQ